MSDRPNTLECAYQSTLDLDRPGEPTLGIVNAIASVKGTDPLDVPSIGHVINTDALNRLLDENGSTTLTVSLSVDDLELILAGDGSLQVYRSEPVSA